MRQVKKHPLHNPLLFSFHDLIRQIPSCVMKVKRLDVNIRAESVRVEENRATCAMGHVEAIRQKLVVNIFGRLLQGNDMPPSCNLLFEGIFFSPTASRIALAQAND